MHIVHRCALSAIKRLQDWMHAVSRARWKEPLSTLMPHAVVHLAQVAILLKAMHLSNSNFIFQQMYRGT